MAADKKVDLRIQRTKDSIRKTFEEMICEMDYEQISIKELAQNFIKRTQGLERPRDMDKITREFFLCSEELGKIGERITCSGNYKYISRKITNDIMNQTWKNGAAASAENPYIQNIIMTYAAQSTLEIYKQWVADGKKIPFEDIIKIAAQLICNGIRGI